MVLLGSQDDGPWYTHRSPLFLLTVGQRALLQLAGCTHLLERAGLMCSQGPLGLGRGCHLGELLPQAGCLRPLSVQEGSQAGDLGAQGSRLPLPCGRLLLRSLVRQGGRLHSTGQPMASQTVYQ